VVLPLHHRTVYPFCGWVRKGKHRQNEKQNSGRLFFVLMGQRRGGAPFSGKQAANRPSSRGPESTPGNPCRSRRGAMCILQEFELGLLFLPPTRKFGLCLKRPIRANW